MTIEQETTTPETPETPAVAEYVPTDLINRDKSKAGTMGRPNVLMLIELLQMGGTTAATVEHHHFLGHSGSIRNHIKADRGSEFPTYDSFITANEEAAANRGGEALALHRAGINLLVAFVTASGKSAKAVALTRALGSNIAGLALSNDNLKERMAVIVDAWASSLSDDDLSTYERTITRLLEACAPVDAEEATDF